MQCQFAVEHPRCTILTYLFDKGALSHVVCNLCLYEEVDVVPSVDAADHPGLHQPSNRHGVVFTSTEYQKLLKWQSL